MFDRDNNVHVDRQQALLAELNVDKKIRSQRNLYFFTFLGYVVIAYFLMQYHPSIIWYGVGLVLTVFLMFFLRRSRKKAREYYMNNPHEDPRRKLISELAESKQNYRIELQNSLVDISYWVSVSLVLLILSIFLASLLLSFFFV